MIAGLLEMLTRRKCEAARATATEWQSLVIDVADGTATDPDEVLSSLERLAKTPSDLEAAVALLAQRRAWTTTVAAGVQAETDHPALTAKIASLNAAFAELESAHDRALWPLSDAKNAAANALSSAQGARIELARTCTDPLALAGVSDADKRMAELRCEMAEHSRELRGKEDRLGELKVQEDRDLKPHVERLKNDIEAMRSQAVEFGERAEKLNAASEAARAHLLRPEAI